MAFGFDDSKKGRKAQKQCFLNATVESAEKLLSRVYEAAEEQ